MTDHPTFGDVLAGMRERRGLSGRQVSRSLPIAHGSLSRWEHGHRLPDLASLARLARAMNLTDQEIVRLVRAADHTTAQEPYDAP